MHLFYFLANFGTFGGHQLGSLAGGGSTGDGDSCCCLPSTRGLLAFLVRVMRLYFRVCLRSGRRGVVDEILGAGPPPIKSARLTSHGFVELTGRVCRGNLVSTCRHACVICAVRLRVAWRRRRRPNIYRMKMKFHQRRWSTTFRAVTKFPHP